MDLNIYYFSFNGFRIKLPWFVRVCQSRIRTQISEKTDKSGSDFRKQKFSNPSDQKWIVVSIKYNLFSYLWQGFISILEILK